MPGPVEGGRWGHQARLNPLDRPERRWRTHADEADARHREGDDA